MQDALYSGVLGALTAGVMDVGSIHGNIKNDRAIQSIGKATIDKGYIDGVTEYAGKSANTNIKKALETYTGKSNDYNIGKLRLAVEADIGETINQSENADEVQENYFNVIKSHPTEFAMRTAKDACHDKMIELGDERGAKVYETEIDTETAEKSAEKLKNEDFTDDIEPIQTAKETKPVEIPKNGFPFQYEATTGAGEPIEIAEIHTLDNGNESYVTPDGQTVPMNAVEFINPEKQMVVNTTMRTMGDDVKGMNIMLHNFTPTIQETYGADTYTAGMQRAYQAGKAGLVKIDTLLDKYNNRKLPEPILRAAYTQGQEFAKIENAKAEERAKLYEEENQAVDKDKLDKHTYAYAKDGTLDVPTENGTFEETQQAFKDIAKDETRKSAEPLKDFIKEVSKKTGTTVELAELRDDINGYFDKSTSHIVINAVNGKGVQATVHELGEMGIAWNRAGMQEAQSAILNWYAENKGYNNLESAIDAYQQAYQAQEGGKTYQSAVDEFINDAMGGLFSDTEGVKSFVEWLKADDTKMFKDTKDVFDKIMEVIDAIVSKIKSYLDKSDLTSAARATAEMELEKKQEVRRMLYRAWDEAIEKSKSAEVESAKPEDTDRAHSINVKFESEYDKWDKKNPLKRFVLGKTSKALQEIGIEDRTISMDSSKIVKIKSKHKEMTDDVIKRIPEVLDNPVVILESMTTSGRPVVMGELYDGNNPIIVVLELNPTNKNGTYINDIRVASSYRRNNTQYLIDNSKVLWVNPDKTKTSNWLRITRVQFPVTLNQTGLINKIIPQKASFVNNNISNNSKNDTNIKAFSIDIGEGGYNGKSMSNRAVRAYENGEKPISKWNKQQIIEEINSYAFDKDIDVEELGIDKLTTKELQNNFLKKSSWHHTGAMYNSTNFYSLAENYIDSISKEDVDNIINKRTRNKLSQDEKIRKKEMQSVLDKSKDIYRKLEVIYESGNTGVKTLKSVMNRWKNGKLDLDTDYQNALDTLKEREFGKVNNWRLLPEDHERHNDVKLYEDNFEQYVDEMILRGNSRSSGVLNEIKSVVGSDNGGKAFSINVDDNKNLTFKLTGEKISKEGADILDKLQNNQDVTLEEIGKVPEIQEAYNKSNSVEPTYNKPNRDGIRKEVLEKLQKQGSWAVDENGKGDYNGDVRRDGRIDIVIGLPASGKSSVLVNPLSQKYNSRVIDSDMAKELLPEFDNGWGAGAVHEESKMISKKWIKESAMKNENIVLPIVGSNYDKIVNQIEDFSGMGYSVNVHLNELPMNKSLGRMIRRFYTDGRFLDPKISFEFQNKPTEVYERLKKEGVIDGYSRYSNDVEYGESARHIEGENLFTTDTGDMGERGSTGREVVEGNDGRTKSRERDSDIRHSLEVNETDTIDLVTENEKLKEANEILKREFELTNGCIPNKHSVDGIARIILRENHSSYDKEALKERLSDLFTYAHKNNAQNDEVLKVMTEIMKPVIEKSVFIDDGLSKQYKGFKDRLRNTGIRLSEEQKLEIANGEYDSYNDFRKKNFGLLRTRSTGTYLEQEWSDLCDDYAGLLDPDTERRPLRRGVD